ncbi:ATP-grasp domain-containing protein [Lysinibacillus antri]|uniref:ATP-grasp domain-containing protein n=1 Tax=Lysinibacillus antri TaxID=2498145 RepID=A0A3S0RJD3_9BACI|nr:ATP-grasp domain-containing protein [Lysinibacillus antri]RUL53085.1 ATP-grasp domain-containing protein [Lysinibacillus antri]
MNAIIFIETYQSGSSREGVRAAKKLGYKVHLITSNKKIIEKKDAFPEIDEIHFLNTEDILEIEETISKIAEIDSISCVISFIDAFVQIAANFSNQFCGTNISAESMKIMDDKLLTRLKGGNKEYSLSHFILKKDSHIDQFFREFPSQSPIRFPLIVKLPKSCGSKDVYLVNSNMELTQRLEFLRDSSPTSDILIEKFVDGPQVIVEAIVYNGKIEISAIIEQQITKQERFIVTGYSLSNELDDDYKHSLIKVSQEILQDMEFKNGNCHLELRHDGEKWRLIEANPRISGGVMNKLINEAYGYNYAEQILKVYLKEPPTLSKTKEECVYAQYLTVDTMGELLRVTGRKKAEKTPGVVEVYIKPKKGQFLQPPLAMGHRYGYVLAKGTTKDEAKQIAIKAADLITFILKS